MAQRSKRRANINQALSCVTRVFEDLSKTQGPLINEEWYQLVAVAVFIGKINGLHHTRKTKEKEHAAN